MEKWDIIVVGAGAAGLLAAGSAAKAGAKVLLLEKMQSEGRKLLITGKGRCNITNKDALKDFIKHIHPDGRFLWNAFSAFFAEEILDLLQKNGLETKLERGGRYFPASDRSGDVLQALLKWIHDLGVEVACRQKVEKIFIKDGKINGLQANGKDLHTTRIILATGGRSYPATGSNGEGLKLAQTLGHKVVKTRPALVPLEANSNLPARMEGLLLKNVKAVLWIDGKKAAEEFGEMVFTDYGLSGPIILSLSRKAVDALQEKKKTEIIIDLKPALDDKKLDRRLLRDLDENGKKKIANVFPKWLPSAMVKPMMDYLRIDPDKECHQITSEERKKIRYHFKNLGFTISGNRPFKEAIITAGGIHTKEISPKTMESKIIRGLYLAGEILDVDADTGGYNLQIAFSTGWLAGKSAAVS
ncbi:MAG: NAD(P)/FAD-dependent oxidoreductase [Bacteroidota bacterium]|nr:NAD(P)/FAD-dependent oxidoreductase [Bacteroidota bacterium]